MENESGITKLAHLRAVIHSSVQSFECGVESEREAIIAFLEAREREQRVRAGLEAALAMDASAPRSVAHQERAAELRSLLDDIRGKRHFAYYTDPLAETDARADPRGE